MNISFARKILNKKINLDKADEDRVQLLIQIMDFKMNTKPQNHEKKNFKKKKLFKANLYFLIVVKWFIKVLKVKHLQ